MTPTSSAGSATHSPIIASSQTKKGGRSLTDEKISGLSSIQTLEPIAQERIKEALDLHEQIRLPPSELYEKWAVFAETHGDSNLFEMEIESTSRSLSENFTGSATIGIRGWSTYVTIECEDGLVKNFTELSPKSKYSFFDISFYPPSYRNGHFPLFFNNHLGEQISPCRIQVNKGGNKLGFFWVFFEEFRGPNSHHKTFEDHLFHFLENPDEEACFSDRNLLKLFIEGSSKTLGKTFTGHAYLKFKGWIDYLIIICENGIVTQFMDKFGRHDFSGNDSYSNSDRGCKRLSKKITRIEVSEDGTSLLCFWADKEKPGCSLM